MKSYRQSDEFKKWAGERGILNIALDVHSSISGGSYENTIEIRKQDIQILKAALLNWEEQNRSIGFNKAVKRLIEEALLEGILDMNDFDKED